MLQSVGRVPESLQELWKKYLVSSSLPKCAINAIATKQPTFSSQSVSFVTNGGSLPSILWCLNTCPCWNALFALQVRFWNDLVRIVRNTWVVFPSSHSTCERMFLGSYEQAQALGQPCFNLKELPNGNKQHRPSAPLSTLGGNCSPCDHLASGCGISPSSNCWNLYTAPQHALVPYHREISKHRKKCSYKQKSGICFKRNVLSRLADSKNMHSSEMPLDSVLLKFHWFAAVDIATSNFRTYQDFATIPIKQILSLPKFGWRMLRPMGKSWMPTVSPDIAACFLGSPNV